MSVIGTSKTKQVCHLNLLYFIPLRIVGSNTKRNVRLNNLHLNIVRAKYTMKTNFQNYVR